MECERKSLYYDKLSVSSRPQGLGGRGMFRVKEYWAFEGVEFGEGLAPRKIFKFSNILARFCTFLPNRCTEEAFFTAVDKKDKTTTKMQVRGPIFVRLTKSNKYSHCQFTVCYLLQRFI